MNKGIDVASHLHTFKIRVDYLHDGDTITAYKLDRSFREYKEIRRGEGNRIRFARINAPELSTPEGKALRDFLKPLEGQHIIVKSTKPDKFVQGSFGGYIFEIYVLPEMLGLEGEDWFNLNDYLLKEKLVKPYDT